MKKVIVIVPLYKRSLFGYEQNSIRQLFKILGKYDIVSFVPKDLNLDYYKQYDFLDYIKLNSHWFNNIASYSKLMLNYKFYELFKEYEYLLIYQPDAWVFKDELLYWCDKGYDFLGAPWFYSNINPERIKFMLNNNRGFNLNGGFSLRKISWLIKNLKKQQNHLYSIANKDYPEDLYLQDYCLNKDTRVSFIECVKFAFEVQPQLIYDYAYSDKPFGCHAFNKINHKVFYSKMNWI